MKRLAAVAVLVAVFSLLASAQRGGGSHGGVSGSHGGFSGSRGGGFSGHSAPAFHGGSGAVNHGGFGGYRASPPPRVGGPPRTIANPSPYPGRGFRPAGPLSMGSRQPYGPIHRGTQYPNSTHQRMPYHSPYGDRRGGWDHRRRDRDRDRFGVYGLYGLGGYPFWPGWGWGYPYLPDYWDSPGDYDSYDSDPGSNYAAAQPYPDYSSGPYEAPPDQDEADQQPSYTPWPYSRPAPPNAQPASAPPPEAPVTLVFKDGRPNERIHNYLMTATTLSVLDQHRQDIPVDQIDLAATAKVNRDAGVEFALPGGGR